MPGYVEAFTAAYPAQLRPVTYDNMANAIGAFERKLMTPGRFDAFMKGDLSALDATERRGLETFLTVGCNTCHTGTALGGQLYRKLGFIFPYETEDLGREKVTGLAADRHVFKVPSLRNVAETGPYFHDGSITDAARGGADHGLPPAGPDPDGCPDLRHRRVPARADREGRSAVHRAACAAREGTEYAGAGSELSPGPSRASRRH